MKIAEPMDGQYPVTWRPHVEGDHHIYVQLNSVSIPGKQIILQYTENCSTDNITVHKKLYTENCSTQKIAVHRKFKYTENCNTCNIAGHITLQYI